MGTTASPLEWQELRIELVPTQPEPTVRLSGESLALALVVTNLASRVRTGRLAISLRVGDVQKDATVIDVTNLGAGGASIRYNITWALTRAGYTEVRFHLYTISGTFESNATRSRDEFGRLAVGSGTYTLYSTEVHDRDEYAREEAWKGEQRATSTRLLKFARIAAYAAVATLVVGLATLILLGVLH